MKFLLHLTLFIIIIFKIYKIIFLYIMLFNIRIIIYIHIYNNTSINIILQHIS